MAGTKTEWELAADASKLLKELKGVVSSLNNLKKATTDATGALGKTEGAEDSLALATAELTKKTNDANAAAKSLNKGLADLTEKGIKQASKGFENFSEKAQHFGDSAGDIDSILMGMTGVLEKIDPQLAIVATNSADMAAGIESVARAAVMASNAIKAGNPMILALTAAVIAAGAAYTYVATEAEKAAEKQEQANKMAEETKKVMDTLGLALRDASVDWLLYTGDIDTTGAALMKVANVVEDRFAPAFKVHQDHIKSLKESVADTMEANQAAIDNYGESLDKIVAGGTVASGMLKTQELAYLKATGAIAQAEAAVRSEINALDALKGVKEKHLKQQLEITRGTQEGTDATTLGAKADAAATKEKERLSNSIDTLTTGIEDYADAIDSLVNKAMADSMSATDKVLEKYGALKEGLEELEAASLARQEDLRKEILAAQDAGVEMSVLRSLYALLGAEMAVTAAASEGITTVLGEQGKALKEVSHAATALDAGKAVKEYEKSLKDISESSDTWIGKLRQSNALIETLNTLQLDGAEADYLRAKSMDFNAATALAGMKAMGQGVEVFGDLFGTAIDLVMARNDELTDQQREMLWILYEMQKAAALTSIAIDTAAAIVSALEWAGPFGPVVGAAIAATGAMQAGIVMATPPPFHVGGIVPDGSGIVAALPGEAFLNRQATANLGADGVADLNSGGGGGGMVIQNVYGHRVFDRFVIDNISKGGPLNSAIRGNTRVGHRKRSTV